MFDLLKRTCDRCGRRFGGEGFYLPSKRRVFYSQACARDYTEESEKKGELRIGKDGPVFEVGCCC